MVTKTVRIEADISEPLERELRSLAATTGRSVSSLISDAVDAYVEAQREFIQAVEEGMKAADGAWLITTPSSRSSSAAAGLERVSGTLRIPRLP